MCGARAGLPRGSAVLGCPHSFSACIHWRFRVVSWPQRVPGSEVASRPAGLAAPRVGAKSAGDARRRKVRGDVERYRARLARWSDRSAVTALSDFGWKVQGMCAGVEEPIWSSNYERALREYRKQTRGVWGFLRANRADERLRGAKASAVQGYVAHALDRWRISYPGIPAWMLPVPDELATSKELAPGGSLSLQFGELDRIVDCIRAKMQPEISVGGAKFPDSSTLRRPSDFDIVRLTKDEEKVFEAWFSQPGNWRIFAGELDSIARRTLPNTGLVWRQHKVRIGLDGVDLRVAAPDTVFVLPYPVSCRSLPHPMGSIMRALPDRRSLRSGEPEEVVYLEIWAHEGAALPKRPSSPQNESEVLLPAGSRFKVARHVDLPYVEEYEHLPRTKYAHGVQVLQL